MARKHGSDSPMKDYPKPPSPHGGSGSFGSGTAKEFNAPPTSYGPISTVQYATGVGGKSKGGGTIIGSPMDEQITPSKPKGS